MSVLLSNATLGVRRRVESGNRNEHGERILAGWGPVQGPAPGRVNERADGGWALGVDPGLWPIRQQDLIVATDGRSWLVNTADLIQNNFDHRVDWVRVDALQRSVGGTEPGGAWFVARYSDGVPGTPPGDPEAPPVQAQTNLWTGYGPPPTTPFGAAVGDEYMDLNTGIVYRLGGTG